jgi:hypothetical protein
LRFCCKRGYIWFGGIVWSVILFTRAVCLFCCGAMRLFHCREGREWQQESVLMVSFKPFFSIAHGGNEALCLSDQ